MFHSSSFDNTVFYIVFFYLYLCITYQTVIEFKLDFIINFLIYQLKCLLINLVCLNEVYCFVSKYIFVLNGLYYFLLIF